MFGSDGQPLRALTEANTQGDRISDLAWSDDGALLAVAHESGQIRVWTIGTRKPTTSFQVRLRPQVAFGPDGRWLVIGDSSKSVKIVDITDDGKAVTRREPLGNHFTLVTSVAVSSDGALVHRQASTACAYGTQRTEATSSPSCEGTKGKVNDVAFGPDGRTIATAGDDGSARVWRTPVTVVLRGHAGAVKSVAANRAGTRLVTAGQGGAGEQDAVRVWSVANGRELAHLAARAPEPCRSIRPEPGR